MNPSLVRDLARKGDAVVALIDAIPRGREFDMTGHLDAKRAAKTALRTLLAEMRNALPCGEPAKVLIRGEKLGRPVTPARRRP